jgi:Tol biopolymer transport system component
MKNWVCIAIISAAASLSFAQTTGPVIGRELNAEAKSKEAEEQRAKRNALRFDNQATVLAFYDRYGKRLGTLGERAIYFQTVFSPDRSRVAVIKFNLQDESADLFVMDVATGAATRITTSARTEFVRSPVWSPDGKRIAYATVRTGQEGFYVRAANGEGPEELLYKPSGAFLQLSDWSSDGRYLTYSFSDLTGGTLYILPLEAGPDRKATEVFHTDLRVFAPRFSPDGRYLAYALVDKNNKGEVFVRPVDPNSTEGPWQVSEGGLSPGFWRRDGKQLAYLARDQAIMTVEVSTSPRFSFGKPKVLFRQEAAVPDRLTDISRDGERFIALPPPRGPQLQQLTIFNREGQVVKRVGEPALYSQPAFSPDGTRLLVAKQDLKNGQQELWTIDIETGKGTRLTSDSWFRNRFVWSPDSKYILYANFHNGDGGIYRMAADGSSSEQLVFRYTPGAFVGVDDIYPDEKSIVCDSGGVILTVPLAGDPAARKEIESLRNEFDNFVARLSPDSRFITFNSDEAKPEKFEVYVRPFDPSTGKMGDQQWRISKEGSMGMLQWRGKEIFFRGQDLSTQDFLLMAAEVETTPTFQAKEPRLLFRLPGPLGGSDGMVSRDGQRFIFAINVPAGKAAQSSRLEGRVKGNQPTGNN